MPTESPPIITSISNQTEPTTTSTTTTATTTPKRPRILVIKTLFNQEQLESRQTLFNIETDMREGTIVRHSPDFDTREEPFLRGFLGRPSEANGYAKIIKANYDKYDGFVILRSVSSMPLVASMLAFSLQGLEKCVAFTGCDVPHSVAHSELRRNYTLALLIAASRTLSLKEVCIVFSDQVFRATRTVMKASWGESQLFASPFFPPLATVVGSSVMLGVDAKELNDVSHKHFTNHNPHNNQLIVGGAGEDSNQVVASSRNKNKILLPKSVQIFPLATVRDIEIFHLIVTPAMHDPTIMRLVSGTSSKTKGVIIAAFGSGTIPFTNRSTIKAIEDLYQRGAAIIVVSQLLFGTSDLSIYDAGSAMQQYAIASSDMTVDCASAKLRYMLSLGMSRHEIYSEFLNPIRGELSSKGRRGSLRCSL